MEKILREIYYNPKNQNAFSGKENVFRAAKKKIPGLTRKKVNEWFEKHLTYTLHITHCKREIVYSQNLSCIKSGCVVPENMQE